MDVRPLHCCTASQNSRILSLGRPKSAARIEFAAGLLSTEKLHDRWSSDSTCVTCKSKLSLQNGVEVLGIQTPNRNCNLTRANSDVELDGLDPQIICSLLDGEIALEEGKQIHHQVIKTGLERDIFVANLLLNMYGQCGVLEDARSLFDYMPETNVVSWNAMISAYAQNGHGQVAHQLFRQMQRECVKATKVTFMSTLPAYDNPEAVEEGKMIHACIVESGIEADTALGTNLVHMYGKCGALENACRSFDKLHERNVVSWTAMIATFANHGHGEDAYRLFQKMQHEGVVPNKITFLGILRCIDYPAMLEMGRVIHACIVDRGFESNVVLKTALVSMYGKCGALEDACTTFDKMHGRTVVSWNAMIDAYVQRQQCKQALELFQKMQQLGVSPDEATFISALSACANLEALAEGQEVHVCIAESGLEATVFVETALVNMYGKCGALNNARLIFDEMCHRNVVSWNAMIIAYAQHGHGKDAQLLFHRMQEEGLKADKITYIGLLSACDSLPALMEGKRYHARVVEKGFELDITVGTAILSMYGKSGALDAACTMFNRMQCRNSVSWNAMISVYTLQGNAKEALVCFRKMQKDGVEPDEATFVSVLTACACLSSLSEGNFVHACIIYGGMELSTSLGTALVNMYGKSGALDEAGAIFDMMCQHDIVTWNAIIGPYAQHGHNHEALKLFQDMLQKGVKPDRISFVSILSACANLSALAQGVALHASIVHDGIESDVDVGTALVNMYGKSGALETANLVFTKLHERNLISWNAMMAAYAQHGHGKKAFQLFLQMQQEDQRPDSVTFLSLLSACSHGGLMDEGLYCFTSMCEDHGIQPKIEHFGCMIDLFGRVGNLVEAENFIYKMALGGYALVWMTLLGGCKRHGDLKRGRRAAEKAMDLDPENAAPYVLLSNMYAKNGKWDEVDLLRRKMAEKGIKKPPGFSSINVDNKVHRFFVGDTSHPKSEDIYAQLEILSTKIKMEGYVPDTKEVLHDVEEHEKERMLEYHSEKLAIAYGLMCTPSQTALHIVKNLRICSDCHTFTKYISKVVGREIIMRDSYRYHYIKNGVCTCGDYW